VRILAASDFHEKKPVYLKKIIKIYKPDIIVSSGDFCQGDWFIRPKGKKNAHFKKAAIKTKSTLKYLDSFNIPIYIVLGNHDVSKTHYDFSTYSKHLDINKFIKTLKNVKIIHNKKIKLGQFTLVGYNYIFREKRSPDYKKNLTALMKKQKNTILFTHDVPYGCKLDIIRNKKSPYNGKHVGDKYLLWAIKKYSPILNICGHMHENQGKCKIGKTLVVNPGFGQNGEAAIIDLPKLKIKFIKL